MPETLHAHAEETVTHNLKYLEFLDKLLQEELAAKHERYLKKRTRLAKLPYHKTLDLGLISLSKYLLFSSQRLTLPERYGSHTIIPLSL
ncbi:ATP-binding protein [Tumebacillus lipolyticus]|uniref:ATP-binding protein n=1 Tax=Tumebacillus lipolyticus TaxID=1280370 RepID=A0ABW5A245_9BACL